MILDPARLLAFDIPCPSQYVTPRDCALYALSVGFGQDPLDTRQLDFVDPHRALKVVPTMALVLAHPGFWMADPASGVDPRAVLHADQALEILAPLPVDGLVRTSTRIAHIVDKGPGKAALVRTETALADADGTLLARLRRTTFLRGAGGFGGDDEPRQPPRTMPDRAPDHVVDLPTRPEQALHYRLNGDMNPLHADPATAAAAGFDRPILHGLCTFGMTCHAVLKALADYAPARLKALSARFAGIVLPGETLRVELWNEGAFRARVVERGTIVVDDGAAILDDIGTRTER